MKSMKINCRLEILTETGHFLCKIQTKLFSEEDCYPSQTTKPSGTLLLSLPNGKCLAIKHCLVTKHVDQELSGYVWSPSKQTKCFTVFDQMFKCLSTFRFQKHDQKRTRCPNGKMFGHQPMVDRVWWPNISHLDRALDVLTCMKGRQYFSLLDELTV